MMKEKLSILAAKMRELSARMDALAAEAERLGDEWDSLYQEYKASASEEEKDAEVPAMEMEASVPEEVPEIAEISEPEPVAKKQATVILDEYKFAQAWRRDRPGSAVKDVRNAISLNDRVLFARELFSGDSEKLYDFLLQVNECATLDDVLALLESHGMDWDMTSDVAYRMMMAIRRKVS